MHLLPDDRGPERGSELGAAGGRDLSAVAAVLGGRDGAARPGRWARGRPGRALRPLLVLLGIAIGAGAMGAPVGAAPAHEAGHDAVPVVRRSEPPVPAEGAGEASPGTGKSDLTAVAGSASIPSVPEGSGHGPGHGEALSRVLLALMVILLAAKVGGHVFELAGQPVVLGELLVGVVLGNLSLVGWGGLDFLTPAGSGSGGAGGMVGPAAVTLGHLAEIGVILLLFQVGLESQIADLRRSAGSALVVAIVGVVTPMGLGWAVAAWLLPGAHWTVPMFVGATLCATSVGITARVLRDLEWTDRPEAQIILGAAVVDDVLGLVVLAVVQGIILSLGNTGAGGAGFRPSDVVWIGGKALVFLGAALAVGQHVSATMFRMAGWLRGHGLLITTSLVFCFGFSWLASQVGLAPIVGAFAAGLVLEKVQYRALEQREGRELEEVLRPVTDIFVPLFFVMMGIQVDLSTLVDPQVVGLALALVVVALAGKQACALGVLEPGLDRLTVGLGMIPRGEVGLIFAAIGRDLVIEGRPVVDAGIYSALVLMVMATTLVTPPLLKWATTRVRV